MLGYAGKILVVDLSTGSIDRKTLDHEVLKKAIGGRGLGIQFLWGLCPAKIRAFDPAVPFMVFTGPVSGTPVLCASKHVVITKSPATGGWLETYSSGHMAAQLKYAGWDGIIIVGRSEKPCYLQIQDEQVEIKDGSFLWGKDAFEAETWLRENISESGGHMAIGPAGENHLPFACINSDFFRQCGRGGAGAVMGAKNLKAIAVNGSGGIRVAEPNGLLAKFGEVIKAVKESVKVKTPYTYGTPFTVDVCNAGGLLPTRNFQSGIFPEATGRMDKESFREVVVADHACTGCPISCGKIAEIQKEPQKGSRVEGPEYETFALLGSNLGIADIDFVSRANILCDRLGMDTMSMGNVLGFAMECFEKGLLTKTETDGLDLRFGNQEAALQLIEKTARRKGFGALLALGVKKMSPEIGERAEKLAMQTKGLEFPGYDPRGAFGAALTYSVNPRGSCHRRVWPPTKEIVGDAPPYTVEGKAEMIKGLYDDRIVPQHLIVCDFPLLMVPVPAEYYAETLSMVTGQEFTVERMYWVAQRTEHFIRMLNCREGFSRSDDIVPDRILEEPLPEGPAKGQCVGRDAFQKMLSEYYALRGWDENGVPTPETLARFELSL